METENKMMAVITIFTCVLIGFFVLATGDIITRCWRGYPVTVEDIISDVVLLICITLLLYFMSIS